MGFVKVNVGTQGWQNPVQTELYVARVNGNSKAHHHATIPLVVIGSEYVQVGTGVGI